jgi:hypothetical protein
MGHCGKCNFDIRQADINEGHAVDVGAGMFCTNAEACRAEQLRRAEEPRAKRARM